MKRLILIPLILGALVSCTKFGPSGRNGRINVFVTTSDTKGTVTTTDGLKSSGAFSMMAYLSDKYVEKGSDGNLIMEGGNPKLFGADDGLYFSGNGNVTLSSSGWTILTDPKWVADVDTYFWAWHPVDAPGRTDIEPEPDDTDYPTDPKAPRSPYTGKLEFNYETPTPAAGKGDADAAIDLLFAYSKKRYTEESSNEINITFHHALSQVRFCVSTDDGTFDTSLKIKSVSISNLATSGHGSFTDSGNAENNQYAYNEEHGSYDQFVWSSRAGSKTFSQTYDADFSSSVVSGWTKGSYTDKKGTETTSDDVVYNLFTCQNVFFMIPQTVTESNMMTLVFEYKGIETTKSVPIADTTGDEWLGDHYYTYKIKATTVGRDIDFSVSLVGWTNRKDEIFI